MFKLLERLCFYLSLLKDGGPKGPDSDYYWNEHWEEALYAARDAYDAVWSLPNMNVDKANKSWPILSEAMDALYVWFRAYQDQ